METQKDYFDKWAKATWASGKKRRWRLVLFSRWGIFIGIFPRIWIPPFVYFQFAFCSHTLHLGPLKICIHRPLWPLWPVTAIRGAKWKERFDCANLCDEISRKWIMVEYDNNPAITDEFKRTAKTVGEVIHAVADEIRLKKD